MSTLAEQYKNSDNLSARGSLHSQFSTNPHGWYKWVFEHVHLPPDASILEVGCGPCGLWRANIDLVPTGWRIILSDFSAGMIDVASSELHREAFSFEVFPANDIPYGANRFDAVLANHMLYHVDDLDDALAGIRKVLRPKGTLFATTNGLGHMCEFRDLVSSVFPSFQSVATGFTIENGAQHLERHFTSVTFHRYEDSLLVPDAASLREYASSTVGLADASAADLSKLENLFEESIAHNGPLRITKESGLFMATGERDSYR